MFIVGLSYALTVLGVRVAPLLGALGLGGLVLALALQPVVGNFVSSVILQTRRPYTVGDTVELEGCIGVVEDIDSRTTQIRSLDGTHVRIPNGNVVGATIVNLTRQPVRRSSLAVGVAYDTDLQQATDVIYDALARVPRVLTEPEPSVNLDGFGDSSIGFSVLYWHASDVPSELAARHDLVVAIHQAFAASSITIAFPQVVVWSGEPKARPALRGPGPRSAHGLSGPRRATTGQGPPRDLMAPGRAPRFRHVTAAPTGLARLVVADYCALAPEQIVAYGYEGAAAVPVGRRVPHHGRPWPPGGAPTPARRAVLGALVELCEAIG